ncbi:hypothetical protein ACP70R_003285 [Stipagrostis hirtigluma subsp. patula]
MPVLLPFITNRRLRWSVVRVVRCPLPHRSAPVPRAPNPNSSPVSPSHASTTCTNLETLKGIAELDHRRGQSVGDRGRRRASGNGAAGSGGAWGCSGRRRWRGESPAAAGTGRRWPDAARRLRPHPPHPLPRALDSNRCAPSSPPPPKVRAAAAGSAAQGRRRRGPAQPAVPIGGRAEAWWDDESVLLAALVVEDTPIRELRRKRRLSSSSATDAGGSTGSSTRKRRPRRQAPGSIPPVVLALDNEEKPNAVADGTKEVKEKEREKEEEKVVVVGKKEAPGSCKKAEASRKLSCAICLEKQNSPKEKETGRTKQNKTLKQRQYF